MDDAVLRAADRALDERRYTDARAMLSDALAGAPTSAELLLRLARACRGEGALEPAIGYAKQATDADPTNPDSRRVLADLQREAGQFTDAIASYNAVLATRPNDVGALMGSARVARALGMASVPEQLLRLATTAAPKDADLWRLLGETELWQGKIEAGLGSLRRAVDMNPSEDNYDSLLFHALLSGDAYEAALGALVGDFMARHGGRLPGLQSQFGNTRDPDRPLRVGFLSSSLRTNHNSLYFFVPLAQHHDRQKTAITVYGDVDYAHPQHAPLVRWLAACRDTRRMDDRELAEAIRRDQIDVLVSALGRGSEGPRTRVLRYRAAPVQMCFHHVMTSGYRDADYWIGDPLTAPAEGDERFSEQLLHIPWNFSFDVFGDHGPVAPLPALRNGYVTFGSATHLWKVNPSVLRCWREVLRALPTARLQIKAPALSDAEVMAAWKKRIADAALPADRVALLPPHGDFAGHMRSYGDVDVILDTFPYGCGNSALEALWMGVPLISLVGRRFVGRQALSMLTAVGLTDFAVPDQAGYVARAVAAAADLAALQALRAGLRERMRASPLFDHVGYCRSVEAAIRTAWRRWCAAAKRGA
ncbi:MAG: tetratricopeptide repeat protein [Alphaproteobacteria bacterium]|nr:tetratricopeptide repeat protein [Alphaproteobacteria bacterium]